MSVVLICFAALYSTALWPLHYIAITKYGMVYDIPKGSRGGVVYCVIDCNSITMVGGMQVGGGHKRMIDSCTKASK